jgi:hypothetical protein
MPLLDAEAKSQEKIHLNGTLLTSSQAGQQANQKKGLRHVPQSLIGQERWLWFKWVQWFRVQG